MDEVPGALVQYGVLGIAALVFAYVIVALYRRADARDKRHEEERVAWATREQALRTEHEAKLRTVVEDYAKNLREITEKSQAREDLVRREFSDLMDTVTVEATKSTQLQADVLNRIHERIIRR